MANIDLVIKIDEEDYKIMKHNIAVNNPLCPLSQEEMVSKVANGTPLPKGHGDLIDRNSILCDDYSCEQCSHTDECFKLLAPTIIDAAKAESEG